MKTIKLNSIVKLSNPQIGEEHLIYIVNELNVDRLMITCINVNMSIQPTELVMINDVVCIDY